MTEYMKMWEEYVAKHYKPEELTHTKLEELSKISDIMKDMAQYWKIKREMM